MPYAAPLTPTSPNTEGPTFPQQPKHQRSVSTNELAPVITITPASLVLPLTPPLTPGSSPTGARPITCEPFATPPINPAFVSLPSPTPNGPAPGYFDVESGMPFGSLHEPLKRHLALLHPNTPPHIRDFVAIRLLSPDRPFGHDGDWKPMSESGDLRKAGVGADAAKGCKQVGEGGRRDRELERMYEIARESFRRLELAGPGVDKL